MDVFWSYNVGNTASSSTDLDSLADANVNANVALDLFLAANERSALSTTAADFEVMVWFGRLGAATAPLGYVNGSVTSRDVSGTTL